MLGRRKKAERRPGFIRLAFSRSAPPPVDKHSLTLWERRAQESLERSLARRKNGR
jgi:hypothetical protein